MVDYQEKIKELEAELSKMQYNKRTQHHYGLVRAKIAQLKEKDIKRRSGGKKGEGYAVKKSGDSTVILVGFPSAGKSTLLNVLTKAKSPVGEYAFTTLTVVPGLMEYEHAKIQVLDVPGIVHGAASGRGRGREVLAVMRSADLAIILVDVNHPEHLDALMKEIYDTGLRLNQEPPIIKITKKNKGGHDIAFTVKQSIINKRTISDILKEFRIFNADVVIRSPITPEMLIDAIEGDKIFIPAIIALNKIDIASKTQLEKVKKRIKPHICISADKKINIDELKELIFEKLNLMRIFCKEVGKKADLDIPLIMKKNITVEGMCSKLHRDFVNKFKYCKVWGKSAKFPGQKFALKHKLIDGDIVEIHLK